jgi:hypothetical protein
MELRDSLNPVRWRKKSLSLAGNRTPTIQLIAHCYPGSLAILTEDFRGFLSEQHLDNIVISLQLLPN